MFMKLHFTSDKALHDVFRIANEVINQSSITDATTLNTYLNTNADATVKAGFDSANSTVIKTVTLSTAKSHYARGSSSTGGTSSNLHIWTTEFQSFDSTRKYYVQQVNATLTNAFTSTKIGTSITGGTMASSQLAINQSDTSANDGTALTVGGTTETGVQYTASGTSGYTNVRTFWMHISDNGMIWGTTNTASYNLGFGNTYNTPTTYSGPWIFGQYQRHDYHNTDANGIIPMMYTSLHRAVGQGFGILNDWQTSHNTMGTSPTYTTGPFRVLNLINAHPQAGTSWPVVNFPAVSWGVGNRFDDVYALNNSAQGTVTSLTAVTFGAVIYETVSTRYPSADLKTQGFAMIPICWRHTFYGNTGGNMSAKAGYYLFNGDYYPGDQFSYNGKTYVVMPAFGGYSNRVGIAVPME